MTLGHKISWNFYRILQFLIWSIPAKGDCSGNANAPLATLICLQHVLYLHFLPSYDPGLQYGILKFLGLLLRIHQRRHVDGEGLGSPSIFFEAQNDTKICKTVSKLPHILSFVYMGFLQFLNQLRKTATHNISQKTSPAPSHLSSPLMYRLRSLLGHI